MPESPLRTAVDPAARALLTLFEGPLSSVRFPDVDHDILEELAAAVERAAAEVEQARTLLAAAEAELDARKTELLARAQRAKAYARVYAEGNVELGAQLDAIVLPRMPSRLGSHAVERPGAEPDVAPKKRGRPRKSADGGTLFEGAAPAGDVAPAEDVAPDSAKVPKSDGRAA